MTVNMDGLEVALLRQHLTDADSVSSSEKSSQSPDLVACERLIKYTVSARFREVISEAITLGILNVDTDITGAEYTSSGDKSNKLHRKVSTLCVGVSSLQLFVQNNWVGPLTEEKPPTLAQDDGLIIDGETVFSSVRHPEYLTLAYKVLVEGASVLDGSLSGEWWALRCVQTLQAVLPVPSATLKNLAMGFVEKVTTKPGLLDNADRRDLALQFHLEAGHLLYSYYEPRRAKEQFDKAERLCGMEIALTGELGKRTKFQQKEISQLVLKVKKQDAIQPWCPPEQVKSQLPTNVTADDDTLLEAIKLSDNDTDLVADTSGIQQAVILGLCYRHRKTMEGSGKIIQEECLAYVNGALQKPKSWSVQSAALRMRSQWECESSRLIQRSMSQFEDLIAQTRRPDPGPEVRLPLVYCSRLPSVREIQLQLAVLYEKVGAINAALEVYQSVESWPEVIRCYTHLGKKEKANKLIHEQLEIKETPLLWCYLGDVHNSEEYYQKAWELSNGKFGRAQRSLGYLHLHNKRYEESLPCFEKSLKINTLQVGVWFSYGCAALACSNYEVSARAFRRCVDLDGENFQAWSNLATAYIRSKQKGRAYTVLKEALKCEFENWYLWDNYMVISTDVGEFEESIRAYHRLLDLKDKHVDLEVLGILVRAIKENLPDAQKNPSADLKPKLMQLFGRLTSKITSNGEIWRLYAELTTSGETVQDDQEKALQFLQKSHRCLLQAPNWEKDMTKCKEVLKQTLKIAQVYISCSSTVADDTKAVQMLSGARLMMKGVLSKVKQHQESLISGDLDPNIAELCQSLEDQLATVMETIEQRRK